MVVTYDTTGGVFKAGTPRLWLPTRLFNTRYAAELRPRTRWSVRRPAV
jgi:hypothetical protein